jgi:hypothetical protein
MEIARTGRIERLRNIDNGPEGLNQIEKNDRAKVAEEIQQM